MESSPRVSEKKATKWLRAIAPDLLPGETALAAVGATRMKPATVGTVITNRRVLGITLYGATADKRIPLEAHVRSIRGFTFPSKWTGTSMVAVTDRGDIDFGTMLDDDVEFARRWTAELMRMVGAVDLAPQSVQPVSTAPQTGQFTSPQPVPPSTVVDLAGSRGSQAQSAATDPPKVMLRKPDAPDAGIPLLTDELRKLALLHDQGVLDADEFKAAKRAVIARHS